MKALRRFARRFAATLLGWRDDGRLRDELSKHLTLLTEEYLRAGLPPDEARREARLRLGGGSPRWCLYRSSSWPSLGYVPARRAARVDPLATIRSE